MITKRKYRKHKI